MNTINTPNYNKIFSDIILFKFPDKMDKCKSLLSKDYLSELDILRLNDYIYSSEDYKSSLNQKHKSYNKETIIEMLEYQKQNQLNNTQLAIHFKLSRNSVAKWKKLFY